MNKELIDNFVKAYTPGSDLTKPDEKLLEFAGQMLPPEIVYLWQEYGFGDYGDGLIKVVDPRDLLDPQTPREFAYAQQVEDFYENTTVREMEYILSILLRIRFRLRLISHLSQLDWQMKVK